MSNKNLVSREEEPQITLEQLKDSLPARARASITPEFVKQLNELVDSSEMREIFRENILTYSDVLKEPNISISAYINAIKFVSFKMMNMSNTDAWKKTFPDRFARMMNDGKNDDSVRAAASCYFKGKVVKTIYEQSLIPMWLSNYDNYQRAINTQVMLMTTANSEKVRSDAANSILNHLKPPEAKKVEVELSEKQDPALQAMRNSITELAEEKIKSIKEHRKTAGEVAASKIIDVTAERVDN